jgi:hypothetical protein
MQGSRIARKDRMQIDCSKLLYRLTRQKAWAIQLRLLWTPRIVVIVTPPSQNGMPPPWEDPLYIHFTTYYLKTWLPHGPDNCLLVPPRKLYVVSEKKLQRVRKEKQVCSWVYLYAEAGAIFHTARTANIRLTAQLKDEKVSDAALRKLLRKMQDLPEGFRSEVSQAISSGGSRADYGADSNLLIVSDGKVPSHR